MTHSAFVTPACATLTVEPVVIGNVEVPCTWMTEAVPGARNPVTAPSAGATGAAGPAAVLVGGLANADQASARDVRRVGVDDRHGRVH